MNGIETDAHVRDPTKRVQLDRLSDQLESMFLLLERLADVRRHTTKIMLHDTSIIIRDSELSAKSVEAIGEVLDRLIRLTNVVIFYLELLVIVEALKMLREESPCLIPSEARSDDGIEDPLRLLDILDREQ